MATKALAKWREKLAYLREQEAVISSPAQRSELEQQVKEALAKIRELEDKTAMTEDTDAEKPQNIAAAGSDPYPPGTVLADRYRVIERLGAGGAGEVYKVEDRLLSEKLALKFPLTGRKTDPSWHKRFFEEVKIARSIDHPNVCRVHDVGLADGRPFFSMALYGTTLESLLRAVGRLPLENALVRGLELCDGLAAIHDAGILHRDLKPANIMLDGVQRVRISDFGLAHEMYIAPRTIAGTPRFMAPELFEIGFRAASIQSDLYALGLILYQLLTGHLPFDQDGTLSRKAWERLHRSYERKPPSAYVENLHSDVGEMIVECLDVNPKGRPSSVAALRAVFRIRAPKKIPPEAFPPISGEATATLPSETTDPGLLAIWLRTVAADHETLLPFFDRSGSVLLEHVYVELQLEHQALRETKLSLETVLGFDPKTQPWVTRRWLLRGDPGSGKTTLLRHFAARLATAGGIPRTPLYESLPRWLREKGDLFARADERLARGGATEGSIGDILRQLADEGRLLFLLDGLDEVPRESRADAHGAIRDLALKWPQASIVVTSRPIGIESPHRDFVELQLLPFDRERQRSFLARWFGRESGTEDVMKADQLLSILDADRSRLEELSGNPLYLTLMALLHESGARPERNRAQLYDQVFDLLYEGRHRPIRRPLPNRNAAHRALGVIGYGMTLDNRDAEPVGDLEERLMGRDVRAIRQDLAAEERWKELRVFLDDLAEQTGILGSHDGVGTDWRFWHRTFREALAAEALARQLKNAKRSLKDAVRNHVRQVRGDEGRWAEPYALAVGRFTSPDDLILALAGENRKLGLRAIATAQGLRKETLEMILGLTKDWRERAEVYKQIPDLIDEPERALALVDQLRKLYRNGSDLAFLVRTVEEMVRRWPQIVSWVNRLRDILLGDLFQQIDTRDGRIALWREIPAGLFQMGSLPGLDLATNVHNIP